MASELKPTTKSERDLFAARVAHHDEVHNGWFEGPIETTFLDRLIADIDRLGEDYRRSLGVRDDLKCELARAHDILRRLVKWHETDRLSTLGGVVDYATIIADARAEIEP